LKKLKNERLDIELTQSKNSDSSNPVHAMISRESGSQCLLDPAKINDHARYFEVESFGAHPTGISAIHAMNHVIQEGMPVFSTDQVINILQKLPNRKAAGLDGIYNEVLKTASHIIAPVLTNALSKTAHFPEEWKTVIIVPKFKNKGSAEEIANYLPIALNSCMRRVYEKCILKELAQYDGSLLMAQGDSGKTYR
jgi:hypothetical protein